MRPKTQKATLKEKVSAKRLQQECFGVSPLLMERRSNLSHTGFTIITPGSPRKGCVKPQVWCNPPPSGRVMGGMDVFMKYLGLAWQIAGQLMTLDAVFSQTGSASGSLKAYLGTQHVEIDLGIKKIS